MTQKRHSIGGISFSSLRTRLMLLVLLAVLPVLGAILYTTWEKKKIAAVEAQDDALLLARLASVHQIQLIDSARELLRTLSKLSEVRRQDSRACSELFAEILGEQPLYTNIGAVRPDGDLFCSALPFRGTINLSDRAYFQRAIQRQDFVVGDYQIGRMTEKPSLNFGYPVLNQNGDLVAVVFAALDLAWLNRLAAEARLPKGTTVTLVDRNGVVLARNLEPESWVGRSVSGASVIKTVLKVREGTAEDTRLDNIQRLYAFTPLRGTPASGEVSILVGVPAALAYSEVNRVVLRNLSALAFATLLVLFLAWAGSDLFVLRRVNALVGATRRVASGDLRSRTGLPHERDELGELSRAFDGMTASLQSNEGERKMAEDRVRRNMERIHALREIDAAITSTLDLGSVLEILLEKIDLILPNSATTVRLINKESGHLEAVACRNLDEKEWKDQIAIGGLGLARTALETKKPVIIPDIRTDSRSRRADYIKKHGLVSYLGVPLIVKGEFLGALSFYTKEEHAFADEEVNFLSTLAGQAAVAIQNSQLFQETKRQALQLQRANLELEKSSRVKSEFLSVMSHEFRTPLNLIMGYAGMMQDGLLGEISEEQQNGLDKIIKCSDDLLLMIMSLLQASSLEAQALRVDKEKVDLTRFLRELQSTYEVRLEKEISLLWDYPADLPVIETDREKLKHVLQNLINNAIKFTDRGSVKISARHFLEAKRVELRVADTGVGIPKESLPTIFEMFQQLDSSITRAYSGVGLGLYIVKKFTEMLGGRVEVESEIGKGSTFTVTLNYESQTVDHT